MFLVLIDVVEIVAEFVLMSLKYKQMYFNAKLQSENNLNILINLF